MCLSRYHWHLHFQGSPCVWHLGNVFAFRSMGSNFLKTMVWKQVFWWSNLKHHVFNVDTSWLNTYLLYMHFLRVFSRFFLTPSPGILARSPGILAPSPGVEFLRLYFWISLGLVAPIAMRNFTQAAAKKVLETPCVLTLWKKKHIFQLNDACTSNCTCPV